MSQKTMCFPNPNVLLYMGMADAYAQAVEFDPDRKKRKQLGKMLQYHAHPSPTLHHRASRYTDDTEMSVANTKALLGRTPQELLNMPDNLVEDVFANLYVEAFQSGGRRAGYSRGFRKCLMESATGAELLQKLSTHRKSTGNGAAMRAIPFGVIPNLEDAQTIASLQAAVTHNTPVAKFAAEAITVMSHFALYEKESFSVLGQYCLDHLSFDQGWGNWYKAFLSPWNPMMPVKNYGEELPLGLSTIWAVRSLLQQCSTLSALMHQTLEIGGDTDTVAALTWGIASSRMQGEKLPDFLEEELDERNAATGSCYLKSWGIALMNEYNPPQTQSLTA